MDDLKDRVKEATNALGGGEEEKSEGCSDQCRGMAREKKGKLKDPFE